MSEFSIKSYIVSYSRVVRQSQNSYFPFLSNFPHCRILSKIGTYFSMSQKSKSMLEFQAHICWVITVDYKVKLGQVKSEFDWKRPKLTRPIRASILSILSIKPHSVQCIKISKSLRMVNINY